MSAADRVDASTPHDRVKQNSARTKDGCFFSYARGMAPISMLSTRAEHATHFHQQRAQSHEPASFASGLSASGALVVRFSLRPVSRNRIPNANQATRRQRPCTCIRNALAITGTDTMRSAYPTNLALTRCELRRTQHHATGATGAHKVGAKTARRR